MENFKKRLLLSITGENYSHCVERLKEVKEEGINTVALFHQHISLKNRKEIYKKIEEAGIEKIPLVHIGEDVKKEEIEFLFKKYETRYFTIHESDFGVLSKWKGFYKNLFLEMSTDNEVAKNVKVEKIGGFCVDLAHYQKQKDRKTIDYEYVYNRRNNKKLFRCNHLSGYSFEEMEDLHYVKSIKDFEYLKHLPTFVFGEVIAIEVNNPIKDQLKFKEYITALISNKRQ